MDRTELTLAVAAALVLAVLLGWVLAWIAGRLNVRGGDADAARALAQRLEAAETARRQAEARLGEVEADLRLRLAEVEADLDDALTRFDRERTASEEVRAAYRVAIEEREA
jgi:hypothetical protein